MKKKFFLLVFAIFNLMKKLIALMLCFLLNTN